MTTPTVTETVRNGNPVGQRVELGRYTIRDEERVLERMTGCRPYGLLSDP